MPSINNRLGITITTLLAVIALASGIFLFQHVHLRGKLNTSQFHGTLLDHPRELRSFSLMGIDNKPFDNGSLQGQWTMIFFGFTHCGYLCPTTMAELSKMYRLLEEQKVKILPRVMMISVDPKRDDIVTLNRYVKAFNPHFYGAIGEEASIRAMTREMGVAYEKVPSKDSENYDVDHSGTVMLFNPQGQLRAFFTTPHQADLLAKDFRLLTS